jgi:hypothetical protein
MNAHEKARGNGQVTTGQDSRHPEATGSNDRLQSGNQALPQFLRDVISSPPRHGEGVHQWLFKIARQLHAHRSEADIHDLLSAAVDGCGRHVPASEITEAVEAARGCAWRPTGGSGTPSKSAPKWPAQDKEGIERTAASDPNALDKLRDSSPVKVSPGLHDSECLLERLFPGNPLVCVGYSAREFFTAPRDSFKGKLASFQFLTPSPMSALEGVTKDGKPSAHCLDNTGARFYLVVECDQGDRDTQAAVIRYLATLAPLAMVVDSGGKSLHSWFHCRGQSEDRLLAFFRLAVSLGGDPATWTRSQFVRMPLAMRDNGKLQAVHYFNHANAETRKGAIEA